VVKQPVPVGEDSEVSSLTRRVVWTDFLRKMKEDLGITAEDVLNAFHSLSEEDLSKPPTQSVDKIVMALGLTGPEAQQAKQYFLDLINKTKPGSLGEELANSNRQISLTLMSQREINRRNNARAVDTIQQKFFMNGAYPRPQDAVAANPQGQTQYIPKAVMDENGHVTYVNPRPLQPQPQQQQRQQQDPRLMPVGSPMAPVQASPQAVPSSAPVQPAKMNEVVAEMKAVESPAVTGPAAKQPADVEGLVKKFMSGQAQSAMAAPAAASAAPAVAKANVTAAAPAAPEAAAAISAGSLINFVPSDNPEDAADLAEYTSDATFLGAMAGAEPSAKAAPSEFQAQLNNAAVTAQPMPVSDLVQSAQVMVRDGGGEMKVTLAPDGLGEVAMRVSVKEGKVNVQMITESDEAKKLIERQLGELKTNLISQNLSIDGIKVDTATNIGKQMEQQYQDAQRQMAQQSLEQFRQDQQGWRRSFFDTPALKVYKGQSEAPRDIPAASSSSKRNNNRRLDLVA
jgi:hypothetical protein